MIAPRARCYRFRLLLLLGPNLGSGARPNPAVPRYDVWRSGGNATIEQQQRCGRSREVVKRHKRQMEDEWDLVREGKGPGRPRFLNDQLDECRARPLAGRLSTSSVLQSR
jgi:hypothetical protein